MGEIGRAVGRELGRAAPQTAVDPRAQPEQRGGEGQGQHAPPDRAADGLGEVDMRVGPAVVRLVDHARPAPFGERDEQSREIVDGVIDNHDEIDEQITTYSKDWSLARMPAVDRALLRIGVWELLYNDEVPTGVAIDEAVELAKRYGA